MSALLNVASIDTVAGADPEEAKGLNYTLVSMQTSLLLTWATYDMKLMQLMSITVDIFFHKSQFMGFFGSSTPTQVTH